MSQEQEAFEKIVQDIAQSFDDSSDYRQLRDFYAEMQDRGLVIKQEYQLKNPNMTRRAVPQGQLSWFGNHLAQQQ